MAELEPMQWEPDGLLLGAGTYYGVADADLEGAAGFDSQASARIDDGVTVGGARMTDRDVRLAISFQSPPSTSTAVDNLAAVVAPLAARGATRVLRWRTRGPTKRALYVPGPEPLTLPGDPRNLVFGAVDAVLGLQLPDPVAYADAPTETDFGLVVSGSPVIRSITNAGTLTAGRGRPTLGAIRWEIIGGPDGCEGPWVRHMGHDGEMWWLTEAVAPVGQPGSTVTVGPDRVTRRGGVLRSAQVRGPDGAPVAGWPALRPGANSIAMGCTTGSFTARIWTRSTW